MFSKISKIPIYLIISTLVILSGCNTKDMDPNRPINADEKRRKNIDEGRGASIKGIYDRARGKGKTNYEFNTANPMWRASLETLDFLPLTTVDYSGGVIITDWYSEGNNQDGIKITIRFLSNEIRSDSLKIIVHKKTCDKNLICSTSLSASNLVKDELRSTILRKASLLEKADKKK